ncbi:MAG: hypothetical protein KBC73_04775 [Burkholderiaceae bacterium]|nr:hypothetical protein [Burkholderiaceae bacterium]
MKTTTPRLASILFLPLVLVSVLTLGACSSVPDSHTRVEPCGPGNVHYSARYFDRSSRFTLALAGHPPSPELQRIVADVSFSDGETLRNLRIADMAATRSWQKPLGTGHSMVVHCPGGPLSFSAPDFSDDLESSASLNRALTDFNAGMKAAQQEREARQREQIYATQRGIAAQQKAAAAAAAAKPAATATATSKTTTTTTATATAATLAASPSSGEAGADTSAAPSGPAVKAQAGVPTAAGGSGSPSTAARSGGGSGGGGGSLIVSTKSSDDAKAAAAKAEAARRQSEAADAAARQRAAAETARQKAEADAAREKRLREMKERGSRQ